MKSSLWALGLAAGLLGSAAYVVPAPAAQALYGPSNHFVIREGVCRIVSPDGPNVRSREEAAKLEREFKLCTAIARQSQSTTVSPFYAQIEKALGVCKYSADTNALTEYTAHEKLLAIKDAADWTTDDLATVGVYEIDCSANVGRWADSDFPRQTASVMSAIGVIDRGIGSAVARQRAGRQQMAQAMAEAEVREKQRAERDQALAAEGYTRMRLADIKLDAKQHLGEKIVTSGYMYIIRNDTGLIMVNKNDTNFVAVDISNASRDFRQKALNRCSSNYQLCQIELKGTLDRKDELIIIRAD
jgi:hypothetical protein